MGIKKIKELVVDISKMEKKRDKLCAQVIEDCNKELLEWVQFDLKEDELKEALLNFFAEYELLYHGLKNFDYNVETLQPRLEKFLEEEFKKNEKYLYSSYYKRFFNLREVRWMTTSRSKNIIKKYSINSDGHLVYEYNGTTFHGFGSIDDNVSYELIVDMDNKTIVGINDSTHKYYDIPNINSVGLDIDFIFDLCI